VLFGRPPLQQIVAYKVLYGLLLRLVKELRA